MTLKTSSLPKQLLAIVLNKGTEPPFTGKYNELNQPGTYLCRQCGLPLFRSKTKFHSSCGWPSFDEEIKDAVTYRPEVDGVRTEIVCARCDAHLGHVFQGENFTATNIRHCVNSLSLDYVADKEVTETEEAIFAGGCFWGIEYYLQKYPGVLKTEVGYTAGHLDHPSYEAICNGTTGHVEAIRVIFDSNKLSYEQLTRYFFEIHDPTQTEGQAPDFGEQYLSMIFYYDKKQKEIAENLIKILTKQGYQVATRVRPVSIFWPAEEYHQDYYTKTDKKPYCHRYVKRFNE
jgi:peptide methionine sulfoxide reductase msrA/msrB